MELFAITEAQYNSLEYKWKHRNWNESQSLLKSKCARKDLFVELWFSIKSWFIDDLFENVLNIKAINVDDYKCIRKAFVLIHDCPTFVTISLAAAAIEHYTTYSSASAWIQKLDLPLLLMAAGGWARVLCGYMQWLNWDHQLMFSFRRIQSISLNRQLVPALKDHL